MHKWLMFVLFIGACVFGVLAMTFGPMAPQAEEEEVQVDENELRIVATSFSFDKEEYHVEKGTTMKVSMRNVKGIHGIEIVGTDVRLEGDKLSQDYTFNEPGTYEIHCIVLCGTGHLDMVSKLVVE